jgi:hypothetical protein
VSHAFFFIMRRTSSCCFSEDIMPCSPLKVNRRFEGTYCLHLHLLSRWYLAQFIQPWRWRRYIPPKRRLTFSGLHGVNIPEDSTIHNHRCENLKSYLHNFFAEISTSKKNMACGGTETIISKTCSNDRIVEKISNFNCVKYFVFYGGERVCIPKL